MLAFPDFYTVGVSTSVITTRDWTRRGWNELYQGYPVQDDYVAQSNVTMAGRLKGRLLVEHGDLDGNVHPAATMRLVDALMKAHRGFDMLLVPNMFHGESGEHDRYLVRRRWDYFVEHLRGVAPPRTSRSSWTRRGARSGGDSSSGRARSRAPRQTERRRASAPGSP